jgi:predicted homoserine dehydrogenase-like protein
MIHKTLFEQHDGQTVRAGVIGTGMYATAIVTQASSIPNLDIPAIADIDIEAAIAAYQKAGYATDDIVVSDTEAGAADAVARNKRVVVQDPLLLMNLPLEVIVESTGLAVPAAQYTLVAIEHGKHVVMVSKEADVTVGPILKSKADQAGVVYTAADGDQHGLVIGLAEWCQALGLEVLCAGKFVEKKLVLDRDRQEIAYGQDHIKVSAAEMSLFEPFPDQPYLDVVAQRRAILGEALRIRNSEMTELAIVANALTVDPERERLHHPVVWPAEIPSILCPVDEGGILESRNAVEIANNLRLPDGLSLAGGVFTVVACANDYSRQMMLGKRHPANKAGTAFLISRPYHLCGVETPMSILSAGLLGVPTSGRTLRQRFDVVGHTTRPLKAGTLIGDDHDDAFETRIQPALSLDPNHPIPFHMATGCRLNQDVPAQMPLTLTMVDIDQNTPLWKLRTEQDELLKTE